MESITTEGIVNEEAYAITATEADTESTSIDVDTEVPANTSTPNDTVKESITTDVN